MHDDDALDEEDLDEDEDLDDEDLDDEEELDEDDFDPSDNVFPDSFRAVLDAADTVELLSLDPNDADFDDEDEDDESEARPRVVNPSPPPAPADLFHGFLVLGKTVLEDPAERSAILSALYRGIDESDGDVVMCFDPRHGIRARRGEAVVDV